jgi:hypothetical protein
MELEERCTHKDIVFKFRSVSSKLIISPQSAPQERHDSDAVGCSSEATGDLLAQVYRLRLNGHGAHFVITLLLGLMVGDPVPIKECLQYTILTGSHKSWRAAQTFTALCDAYVISPQLSSHFR